jgi:hypothetical protein
MDWLCGNALKGKDMTRTEANRDAEFLSEALDRLRKGREGDPTQFELLEQMLSDWQSELRLLATGKN